MGFLDTPAHAPALSGKYLGKRDIPLGVRKHFHVCACASGVYYPFCLTEMTPANNPTREASCSVPLLGISHTSFTPSKRQLTFLLCSNSFVFLLSDICLAHWFWLSSVQFSRSVISNSLQPHALPHARPPCLSPTPRVYSKSCPLSR